MSHRPGRGLTILSDDRLPNLPPSYPMTQKEENRTVRRHIEILSLGCENPKQIKADSQVKNNWSKENCRLWLYRQMYEKHNRTPDEALNIVVNWWARGRTLDALRRAEEWTILTSAPAENVVRGLHGSRELQI
ncbi:hypothetical protein DSL72_003664 [Monilinia vaccinii-corymbosi]|uniref:Uncharacterized protein n=1 Tax=Monilinia vaccinii-corymbosi TaxID=61207 RepID=A0A8A3NUL8_9HELO|nr:hypothetical protein DSL72_003664 [Monilinia vaccinii-corymbosi]